MDVHSPDPVRASDSERDRALAELGEQVSAGRMSTDTFERRVEAVLRARSRAELAEVLQDLPRPRSLSDRVTGLIAGASSMTARLQAAWRGPRMPRFTLPPAGLSKALIGRAPGCDLVLADPTVSRIHAELYRVAGQPAPGAPPAPWPGREPAGGPAEESAGAAADGPAEWMVRDLGSMNGTRVNGWRLTGGAARLRPGDRLGLGDLELLVAAR